MLDMKNIYEEAHKTIGGYGTVNHAGAMQEYIVNVIKPESILDVGCGDGAFCRYLESQNISATGIDIAQDGGDIRNLYLDNNAFDWSTAFDVLEHIPVDELDLALSEMKRVAKKGMMFSICFRDSIYKVQGRSLHETVKPAEWWLSLLKNYGKVEVYKMYSTCGYYIVRFL